MEGESILDCLSNSSRKIVVTGGSGFVGKALCRSFLEDGFQVVSISRRPVPDLEAAGATCLRLDLSDSSADLDPYIDGAYALFHTAAHVAMWGDYSQFYEANVVATRRLVESCKRVGCRYFIFTSSPSVIAGDGDLRGVDETIPYPSQYSASYPRTKAEAERYVLEQGKEGKESSENSVFKTVSLRPHLIFGPGDTNLLPTIIERARAGRLPIVGRGKNLVDVTFIDDCVLAHKCALKALESGQPVSGEPFFISQGEPVGLWAFIDEVLRRANIPPIKRRIGEGTAFIAAHLLESLFRFLPNQPEPPLTKFLVKEMSTDHYFNITKARTLLNFHPKYTILDGLRITFGN